MPGRALGSRLAQYPGTALADLPILFEDRDELVWSEKSSRWVSPAKEGLDADDGELRQVVDRLVDEVELLCCQGGAKVEFEPDPAPDICLQLRIEEFVTVLTAGFGLIEGDVRIAKQFSAAFTVAYGD